MELFWWLFTVVLFAVGLIGTVLPVFPGTTFILAGAIIHRIMLGPEKSIGWRSIAVLSLLTLATYALDFLSGYFGRSDEMGNDRRCSRCTDRRLFRNRRIACRAGDWRNCRRISCRQENGRRWPGRLGEFDGKSRRDDRQTRDRTRHDRDLLHDRATAILSSL
ncbi:MAG: hypothetical protein DME72_08595, partial [Verrucomicrobia bacterium]